MNLIGSFVRSPVKVSVGVLLLLLFGYVALDRMPMQLTPEVQTPTITVETRWPGASPQEIEREIVLEQEEQLKSVEAVTKMTSESSDSSGKITLEFLVGTDMDKAVVDVIGRLEQVPSYPEDADKPIISTSNAADRPIAWFILSAQFPNPEDIRKMQQDHPEMSEELDRVLQAANPGLATLRLRIIAKKHPEVKTLLPPEDLDVTKLKRFAEDEIEARFERVSGVSQSNVIGGLEEELQVVVDPHKLAARNLTIADVRQVLRGQNTDVSAGDFWESKRRWVVRTLGQFRTPEQVEQQLLANDEGGPVYVRDVAQVRLGYRKPDGLVRRFGESSIAVNCLRETGANVLDLMEGLRVVNQELNEGILKDRGLVLTQVYDETDYIYSSVDLVQENIFIGGALTMIVLMSFLHLGVRTLLVIPAILATGYLAAFWSPWFFVVCLALIIGSGFWFARGALVVGLAIPISIIGTFLILGALGRSLNVISLAGLAFAVGMLVDNAVVVLENIFRRYSSLGEKPMVAAVRGTQEVWGAVVASTLTTIAVFLPIVFVQEEAGQLFRDIALAISGAVALSMLVSMTVIPTASSRLFGGRDAKIDGLGGSLDSFDDADPIASRHSHNESLIVSGVNKVGGFFVQQVVGINDWIQHSLIRRLATIGILVGAAVALSWVLWPKVEYLPTGNRNLVFGILIPPPGYNLNQMMEMGETVERELRPYWDTDAKNAEEAGLDFPVIGDFFFVARGRQVFLGIRARNQDQVGKLVPLVQRVGSQLPGTFAVAKQSSLFEQGLTAGRTIDIEITGPELKTLVGMGGQILGGNPNIGLNPIGQIIKVERVVNGETITESAQARPVPSLDLSSPEVHIEPKLTQAAEMQISTSDLGYAADALIDGAYAGDYYIEGDKIDLTIVGDETRADSVQRIRGLPVATPIGQVVPLEALATIEMSSGPEQVNHRERLRAITIEVSPPAEMPLEDAMELIKSQVIAPLRESGQLEGGYRVNLAGTADKLDSTWKALQSNVILALLITYLLMAALFESWIYPAVVILSVPLGAVGGIIGLQLLNVWLAFTGQPTQMLDVLTMLGFVILIGTVVNNPILIVHQSLNLMREENLPPRQAILESVRTRIRPIFMTTTTTVLGLLPLVLFPGAGSELYRGLGSVVLGGLALSTVFTLFLVPTLFSVVMETQNRMFDLVRSNRDEPFDQSEPAVQEPVGVN
ncbi:efflux RND transporter permease subunit [Thalassoroseus pseudoceratinae]|uniref:efflux RND transporter permease subunit n=1 Tax=Thalassoroseus pseudoceratinae TaxID=2713176 RepID=UPI001421F6BF|nr:efflux RND transporter permease subunit [Thalassoroseus pseudoceratinae]